MTCVAPDRLRRTSYPCVVPIRATDVASCFDQARLVIMEQILGPDCWTSGTSRLSLAFNTISFADEIRGLTECEALLGVLKISAGSVTIAMGLFVSDRCVAIADCVLLHVGNDGQLPWTPDTESVLTDLAWRYLGAPTN